MATLFYHYLIFFAIFFLIVEGSTKCSFDDIKLVYKSEDVNEKCNNFKKIGQYDSAIILEYDLDNERVNLKQHRLFDDGRFISSNLTFQNRPVDRVRKVNLQGTKAVVVFVSECNYYLAVWDILNLTAQRVRFLTNESASDFVFHDQWLFVFSAIENDLTLQRFQIDNTIVASTQEVIFSSHGGKINEVNIKENRIEIVLRDKSSFVLDTSVLINFYAKFFVEREVIIPPLPKPIIDDRIMKFFVILAIIATSALSTAVCLMLGINMKQRCLRSEKGRNRNNAVRPNPRHTYHNSTPDNTWVFPTPKIQKQHRLGKSFSICTAIPEEDENLSLTP